MKTKNFVTVAALTVLMITASCKKTFFTDVNKNPNAPSEVPCSTILPSVEAALAYTQGGDLARYTSLFTQQTYGYSRQSTAYYNYIITGNDLDNLWGNLYTSTMNNINDLMKVADKGDGDGPFNAYGGVARLLMAYTLQITVDSWGSIPYSNAFKGLENLHPDYDKDVDIYNSIEKLVDDGIAKLNDANAGTQTPGSEDVVYGGDAAKWVKFGHALKARLAIHQAKGNNAMAQKALDEIAMAFSSNSDNAIYVFGVDETASSPVYQFNQQRGDIDYYGSTLVEMMLNNSDPRIGAYFDSTYSDINGVGIGSYFGDADGHVELITYDELLFISAEAKLRLGDASGAEADYQAAITANMNKFGLDGGDISTYVTANGTLPGDVNDAIKQVAKEEYIALYLNPEAWTVYRRTASPDLVPVAGSNGVPRRLIYPQSELTYNSNSYNGSASMFSPKIFWDN